MEYTAHYDSPLGGMTMVSDGASLVGLWFDGQKNVGAGVGEGCEVPGVRSLFEETRRWLEIYFGGREPDFTPPIALQGSDFRRRVWEMLLEIPYGHTMSYGEIAQRIAAEQGQGLMSAQAVGGAVGQNRIALIVPCHRVVGAGGKLTGYAWGIERKLWLLRKEGIVV